MTQPTIEQMIEVKDKEICSCGGAQWARVETASAPTTQEMKPPEEWCRLLFANREKRMSLFEGEDRSLGVLMEMGNPDWLLLPFIRAIQKDAIRAALTAQAGDGWKPIEEVPEGWRLEQLAFYRNSENQPKWICDLYNEKANRLASTNCHDTAAEALRAAIAAAKDGK